MSWKSCISTWNELEITSRNNEVRNELRNLLARVATCFTQAADQITNVAVEVCKIAWLLPNPYFPEYFFAQIEVSFSFFVCDSHSQWLNSQSKSTPILVPILILRPLCIYVLYFFLIEVIALHSNRLKSLSTSVLCLKLYLAMMTSLIFWKNLATVRRTGWRAWQ